MSGILFQTSFDHYTTLTPRWNTVSGTIDSNNGITASAGRNSTAALVVAGGGLRTTRKTLPSTPATIYFAFAFKTNALPNTTAAIWELLDNNTQHVSLALRTDGLLQFYRGGVGPDPIGPISSVALSAGVFYHLEGKCVINNSTGSVELRINEVSSPSAIPSTGSLDTQNTANAFITQVGISNGNVTSDYTYDDIIVRDDTWSGDQQVKVIKPNGAGNYSEWTPTSGANYTNVDDAAPDGDTTVVQSSTVNDRDTYTYEDIPTTATVTALITLFYAKKTDAGTAKFVSLFRLSSTDYASATEHAPSDASYDYHEGVNMTSPATAVAWTPTEVNALEHGPKRTA